MERGKDHLEQEAEGVIGRKRLVDLHKGQRDQHESPSSPLTQT